MIQSQYILDILDLTFDDHKASELLRQQVSHLTVRDIEHTSVGAFINFSVDLDVLKYKVEQELLVSNIENQATLAMINGVEIINNEQNILADATVHFENGVINHLEIWNKNGENYPLTEPTHYELNQTWRDKQDRRSIKR